MKKWPSYRSCVMESDRIFFWLWNIPLAAGLSFLTISASWRWESGLFVFRRRQLLYTCLRSFNLSDKFPSFGELLHDIVYRPLLTDVLNKIVKVLFNFVLDLIWIIIVNDLREPKRRVLSSFNQFAQIVRLFVLILPPDFIVTNLQLGLLLLCLLCSYLF